MADSEFDEDPRRVCLQTVPEPVSAQPAGTDVEGEKLSVVKYKSDHMAISDKDASKAKIHHAQNTL